MTKGATEMEHEYEVLDRNSGNLVATFPSEQATRAAVQAAIQRNGSEAISPWLVGRIDYEGPVLEGPALIAWALAASAAPDAREPTKVLRGEELVARAREWIETWATTEQRSELAPLVDTLAVLVNEANALNAEAEHIGPIRTTQDVDRARAFVATMEQHLQALTQQRLAIRDWFASQPRPETAEEAAVNEAIRILFERQLSQTP